jgi:hypothetical protein
MFINMSRNLSQRLRSIPQTNRLTERHGCSCRRMGRPSLRIICNAAPVWGLSVLTRILVDSQGCYCHCHLLTSYMHCCFDILTSRVMLLKDPVSHEVPQLHINICANVDDSWSIWLQQGWMHLLLTIYGRLLWQDLRPLVGPGVIVFIIIFIMIVVAITTITTLIYIPMGPLI